MSSTYKRGALTIKEVEYIRNTMDSCDIATLAEKLNRSEEFVQRAINRLVVKSKVRPELEKEELENKHILAKLMGKPIWKDITRRYTENELPLVKHHWIQFYRQFAEDITHAEETQIFKVIDLEVIIDRNRKEAASALESIQRKEEILLRQYKKPFTDQDSALIAQLEHELSLAKTAQREQSRELNDALDRHGKLLISLKSTRDQRYKDVESGKKSFFDLLQAMSDVKKRQAESREIELYRLAVEKERRRLSEYHQYDNDEVDRPLLNADSVSQEESE